MKTTTTVSLRTNRSNRKATLRRSILAASAAALLGLGIAPQSVTAAPAGWNGTNATWQNATSWTPNGIPIGSTQVTFSNVADPGLLNLNATLGAGAVADTLTAANAAWGFTGGTLALTTGTIDVGTGAQVTFFAGGSLTGAGGITKTGAGILLYSDANSYTGATVVNAGQLSLVNVGTFGNGNSAMTIGAAGIVTLQGVSASVASLSGVAGAQLGNNNAAAATLTIAGTNGAAVTYGGSLNNIAGVLSVTKNGAGTQILTGANGYTGSTSINGGSLQVDGSITGSIVSVNNGGTLSGGGSVTLAVNLTGTGIINLGATGNLAGSISVNGGNWNGLGSVTNGVNVNTGNLTIGAGANMTVTGPLRLAVGNAATFSAAATNSTVTGGLLYTSTANSTFQGVIAGAASTVTMNSGGNTVTNVLTLSGTNTYGGATAVQSGVLEIASNGALSGSGANVTGGTLALRGGVTSPAIAASIAGNGVTSGAVPIGALFGGFNGGTSTYAGAVTLSAAARIGVFQGAGGIFNLTGGVITNGNTVTLGQGFLAASAGVINMNSVISGAGGVVVDSQTTNLNASNTYTGPTSIINGGILNATVAGALPAPPADGGTGTVRSALLMDQSGGGSSRLNLVGFNQAVASLTGVATSTINLNANTLTVGTVGGSTTFNGVISGTGSLIKDGASTLVLGGANTYGGSTTVQAGTLSLTVANALPVGTILNFNNAAGSGVSPTLNLNGNAQSIGGLNIVSGGAGASTINLGGATLTLTGDFNFTNNTVLPGNGLTFLMQGAGALDLAGGTRTFNIAGNNNTVNGDVRMNSIIQNGGITMNQTSAGAGPAPAILNLNAANTYDGVTTINSGVIRASNNLALGSAVGGTVVGANAASAATLQLGNGVNIIGEALTINGVGATQGTNTLGALTVVPGANSATFGGPITVASNSTIQTAGNGGVLTLNGTIDKTDVILTFTNINGGTGTINVNGSITGNAVGFNDDLIVNGVTTNLNAANTYLGPTFITSIAAGDGILNANVANALPIANGRTSVTMDAAGAGSSVLNIGGIAAFPLGANQSIASLAGIASSRVTLGNNTLTIGFGTAPNTNGTANATFAGVISGTSPGFAVIKDDTSTQILTGINTYIGFTAVNGGTLQVGDGATANSQLGTGLVFVNPTGTLDIRLANGGIFANTVNTAGVSTVVGTNTAGNTQRITGAINGTANFLQNAGGTSVFENVNTYQGGTRITNASTIIIGTITAGATAGQNISTNTVVVDGASTLNLVNVSGGVLNNNITNGNGGAGLVTSTSTFATTLTGSLTDGGAGTIALTQNGSGTTTLVNAGNTYTGATRVLQGTLQIGTAGLVGSVGNQGTPTAIVIGTGGTLTIVNTIGNALANNVTNGIGGTGTLVVNSANTNTLSGTLTDGAAGTLALTQSGTGTTILTNAGNTYTGATTISGGTLQIGTVALTGSIGATAVNLGTGGTLAVVNVGPTGSVFANNIQNNLGGTGLVNHSSAAGVNFTGNILDGVGSLAFTQSGTGASVVGGANTYSGVTNVTAGTLFAASATALGSAANGTVVAAGATLDLFAQNIAAEAVQIQGNGDAAGLGFAVPQIGALSNTGGFAATLGGPVTLAASASIGSNIAPSAITLTNTVSGGAGATLTKVGTDTLTLNGVNNYSGATVVAGGILVAGNASALGNIGAGTTVNAGAALSIANGINVIAEPLFINGIGAGAAAPGALTQAAGGVSTFTGPITAQTNATINANGGALTLTGPITKTGVNLTLAGTGGPGSSITVNGAISGNNGLLNSDLLVNGTTVNLNIANNYLGQTFITSIVAGDGIVNANVASALPTSPVRTQLIMDAGFAGNAALAAGAGASVLNVNTSQSVASLTSAVGTGSVINLGANTLTIGFGTANVTLVAPLYVNSTFNGVINGTGGITKDETSVQILAGLSTYTGATIVQQGTLQSGVSTNGGNTGGAFGVNSATTVGTAGTAATLALNGFNNTIGTLAGNVNGIVQNGSAATASTLTLGSGVAAGTTTFLGLVQNGAAATLSLTKVGAGTQVLGGAGSPGNTYTGTTTVNAGTLQAGIATNAFGVGSATTVNAGGTLELAGNSNSIGSLASTPLPGGGFVQNNIGGAATLTIIGNNAAPVNFGGVIRDTAASALSLTKNGAGTQTISGANTYRGTTTVNGGILSLAGGAAILNPSIATPAGGAVVVGAAGTLNLANSETIGTLSGPAAGSNVTLGVNTLTLGVANIAGGNTTFAGTIAGVGGSVVKNSADAFTLTGGTSTYTGGTTLNGGTLNIDASSSAVLTPVAGTGPVGRGTLTINAANNGAPGGNTLGTTSVAVAGNTIANAVTLNASFNVSNLQAGIPNVNPLPVAGVPGVLASSGIVLSGPVAINTANVTINTQSGFLDFTGVVSGAGNGLTFTGNTFTLIGAGTAADAANTYTGLTTVSSGFVSLGKGGAGTAIPGNLQIDVGAVVQGISRVGPFANANIADNQIATTSSALVNGTLDLAGLNQSLASLTGAGTVRLDDSVFNGGAATAAAILSVDSGSFTGSIVDSGAAPGSGQVVKNTAGVLNLLGASTYTGGTTLNLGTLGAGNTKAFGSGNLTINGGTLQTVGGPLVINIGGGNVAINGGTVIANVGGTLPGVNHDQILTTGNVGAITGTLALVQQGGYLLAPGDKVNLVQAGTVAGGSVNGTAVPNSGITGLAAFSITPLLIPTVNLYPTTVTLEAMQGLFANNPLIIAQIGGFTPNQLAVAGALDSVSAKNLFKTGIVRELNFLDTQPLSTLKGNLDKIAPEELTSIFHLGVSLANVNSSNLTRRMADIQATGGGAMPIAPARNDTRYLGGANGPVGARSKEIAPPSDARWGAFLTGSGEFTTVGSTSNAAGYKLNTGGVTAGMDYRVSEVFAVGISLGYSNTSADLVNGGSLDVDGGRLGLYATYFDQNFHVNASVTGGINSNRSRRVTPNNTVATGNPDGSEINVLIGAGYDFKFGALTVGPIASYQYTNMRMDGFTETGAFAPLTIKGESNESSRTTLGIRASFEGRIGSAIIRPEVRLAWQHEFGATSYAITSRFATLGGNAFTVSGPSVGRDSLLASAGFIVMWNERLGTYVYYDGNIGAQNLESHNISGGVRFQF